MSKVEEQRREWTQSQNYIQFRTQHCSYCGLPGALPRGRNCPAYGVQFEICRKYNHFTSVLREIKMDKTNKLNNDETVTFLYSYE